MEVVIIMQVIALFFPSFLGTSVFTKMEASIEGVIRYFYTYIHVVLCTNVFTMFTVVYVLGVDGVVSNALESFSFFMIYTIMACVFSVLGAMVGKILRNNFAKWN